MDAREEKKMRKAKRFSIFFFMFEFGDSDFFKINFLSNYGRIEVPVFNV